MTASTWGTTERQKAHRPKNAERSTHGGYASRVDPDQVGAELGEFRNHKAVQTLADGGKKYHRGNPYCNPEPCQEASHPLSRNGTDRESYEICDQHL